MRKSKFKEPKNVLIFNGAKVLIGITRSLHAASLLTGGNLQAISFCCLGKYISTGGFYYRHIHPDIEIDLSDLDSLGLEEYDKMCGQERRYHTVREMAKKRYALEDNRKKTNKEGGKI
ncbi:hypothetical protein [Dysgonomonas termitidis]|uniref:Uncharacterized protein n=1 Tax=Dysgonomonas termitidis TaxID=1516126 RepID=A0ABV9KRS7_9BACT